MNTISTNSYTSELQIDSILGKIVLEKLNLPEAEFNHVRLCDSCTQELNHGEHVVVYFCDVIWLQSERHNLPQVIAQEIYCLDCYPNAVPLPHLGTNEGFIIATMEYQPENSLYSYDRHQVIQGSSRDSGIEWNPIHLMEEYYPAPIEALQYNITPMYLFVLFRKIGVDLRGFVKDGELYIPEQAKEALVETVRFGIGRSREISYQPEML